MKKLHVCFRASLAALLMLAAVPATAADVKELFAIDLHYAHMVTRMHVLVAPAA